MLWRGTVMALVCNIVLSGVGSAAEDEAFHEAVDADIERAVEWAARTGLSALRIAADYHRAEMAKIAADEGSLISDVIYRISCSTVICGVFVTRLRTSRSSALEFSAIRFPSR